MSVTLTMEDVNTIVPMKYLSSLVLVYLGSYYTTKVTVQVYIYIYIHYHNYGDDFDFNEQISMSACRMLPCALKAVLILPVASSVHAKLVIS